VNSRGISDEQAKERDGRVQKKKSESSRFFVLRSRRKRFVLRKEKHANNTEIINIVLMVEQFSRCKFKEN
jgi:hypothetical protein